MATPYDYSKCMEEVKAFIRKQVYKTTPSYAERELPSWKYYNGEEDLETAAKKNRLFEIVEDTDGPVQFLEGNGTRDYDVQINLEVCYGDSEDYNTIAFGDYDKIKTQLLDSDKSSINQYGFNMFTMTENPSIEEQDEENEWRIATFPIMARITVTHRAL